MPGRKENFEIAQAFWRQHKELLKYVGHREQRVVAARYGLDGNKPMTLEEVGQLIGRSRERARQMSYTARVRVNRILNLRLASRKVFEASFDILGVNALNDFWLLRKNDEDYLTRVCEMLKDAGINDPNDFLRSRGVLSKG